MKTYIKFYTKGGGKLTFRCDGQVFPKLYDFNKSHCQEWALICIPENTRYTFKKEGPVGSMSRYDRYCPVKGHDVYELYNYIPGENCDEYCSSVRVDRVVVEFRDRKTVTKILDLYPDKNIHGYDEGRILVKEA